MPFNMDVKDEHGSEFWQEELRRIKKEGAQACLDGKVLKNNPYDEEKQSTNHRTWKEGWLEAREKGIK